jgi:tetratricopeptide (TPR) repeat protein
VGLNLINYYEILGVEPTCSPTEIKSSFRRKAKELHPDLKPSDSKNSEELMRVLLDAYEVLSDPLRRSDYDREFIRYSSKVRFNYREFLKSKKDDMVSQSKLIFYDLLNSEAEAALELHEELSSRYEDFSLEHYLGHEDYMDCLFLMAEALEKKGEFIRACELYKSLCMLEYKKPYFHHFMEEVIDRLRSITCFKMTTTLAPQVSIKHIKDLIRFNFSRKDNAFFYKKIAEIYCALGQKELALQYLQKGLRLDQKLPGVKKLKEKIGYSELSAV